MLSRRTLLRGTIGAGMLVGLGGGLLRAAPPGVEAARALLGQAAGAGGARAGMLAVLIEDRRPRTIAVGGTGRPGVAWGDGTVVEIGSITKVLTALLLADMVTRGEVAFDDLVARYLPASLVLREHGGPITLLDLATYTSGLPNMPGNMPPKWWELTDPFAAYTEQQLAAFLAGFEPADAPGTQYRYANLGFGLLGIALAHRAGKSYEALLVERVCAPLGLRDTRITLTGAMRRRLAQGHNRALAPVPLWQMPTLPGAGAARSTAGDLTLFLQACMGRRRTPLRAPLARLLATRRPTSLAGTEAALGWFVSTSRDEEIVWKTGLTAGFASFVGFSPRSGRGAIVLSNGYPAGGMGFRLLNPAFDPGALDSILR